MGKFDKVEIAIRFLQEDTGTPRSVREKLGAILIYLKQPLDDNTKISNVLTRLEDFSSDVNIPPFVRTQIYSISSMLESIERG